MHLFTDYINPLTHWLYAHPDWALLITFLISFAESIAIIGSIIPGSITMTAIGILAGSGIMRIDLTFLAAILGAIAGDSGSYALGCQFSERLINTWPFKNYPNWIKYGTDYFDRYGAASVLIGRFFGPMRSIIPVIAGMMHMKHWQFFSANVLSAIGWALLYLTPGVLIGAASSELSTQSATRLFVLILIMLVVIWLTSLGIKWLFVHTNHFLRINLHVFWTRLQKKPRWRFFTNLLTPHNETNHYPTALLFILSILCFCTSTLIIALVLQEKWVATINLPTYLFFQSLGTQPFDTFFIAISLAIGSLPLWVLTVITTSYALYYRDWRLLRYWFYLCLTTGITLFLLTLWVPIPSPNGLGSRRALTLFPEVDLTIATSLIGFFIFYVSTRYQTVTLFVLRVMLLILLFLAGIAPIYLGDNWLTSVMASYFIGLTLCLTHWVFYRRNQLSHQRSQRPILLLYCLLTVAACVSCWLYFKKISRIHNHQLAQYVITDHVWWNQQQPLLPIYSTNRIGQRTGLLNIQYIGSIKKLQHALETNGWKRQPNSFFYALLMHAGEHSSAEKLPFMAQLYQNRKPSLLMTYKPSNQRTLLILRFWRSNYHLYHHRQPIWLGSISTPKPTQQMTSTKNDGESQPLAAYQQIIQALNGFKYNQITLSNQYLKSLPPVDSSVLLIIKDPET